MADVHAAIQTSVTAPQGHAQFPREITDIMIRLLDSPEERLAASDPERLFNAYEKFFTNEMREFETQVNGLQNFEALMKEVHEGRYPSNEKSFSGALLAFYRQQIFPADRYSRAWSKSSGVSLSIWQKGGFSHVENPKMSDLVACTSCKYTLAGVQPWMQPIYYHHEGCKKAQELIANGVVRSGFGENIPTSYAELHDYILLHVDVFARKRFAENPTAEDSLTQKAKAWRRVHQRISETGAYIEFFQWLKTAMTT